MMHINTLWPFYHFTALTNTYIPFLYICVYLSAPMSLFINEFTCNSVYRCTMDAKKLYWERILTFSFAHAELRKQVFLNFLRYLPTDFEAVIKYVFGMITRMMYSVEFFICTCGNMLVQIHKRVFPLYLWYWSMDLNAVFVLCSLSIL